MTTALDLIAGGLRKISSYTPGQGIDGKEIDDCLAELNRMLGFWSTDGLLIPYRTIENFPLTIGQQSYTIGTGGNFNTQRPDVIKDAFTRDTNNIDIPLKCNFTRAEYDAIPLKSNEGLPRLLYYDKQYPLGIIYIYPTALQSYTLYIDSEKPLSQISSTSTVINLPKEHEAAIVFNFAVWMAPEYGTTVTPEVAEMAKLTLQGLRKMIVRPPVASFDPLLSVTKEGSVRGTHWNIYNG